MALKHFIYFIDHGQPALYDGGPRICMEFDGEGVSWVGDVPSWPYPAYVAIEMNPAQVNDYNLRLEMREYTFAFNLPGDGPFKFGVNEFATRKSMNRYIKTVTKVLKKLRNTRPNKE